MCQFDPICMGKWWVCWSINWDFTASSGNHGREIPFSKWMVLMGKSGDHCGRHQIHWWKNGDRCRLLPLGQVLPVIFGETCWITMDLPDVSSFSCRCFSFVCQSVDDFYITFHHILPYMYHICIMYYHWWSCVVPFSVVTLRIFTCSSHFFRNSPVVSSLAAKASQAQAQQATAGAKPGDVCVLVGGSEWPSRNPNLTPIWHQKP